MTRLKNIFMFLLKSTFSVTRFFDLSFHTNKVVGFLSYHQNGSR